MTCLTFLTEEFILTTKTAKIKSSETYEKGVYGGKKCFAANKRGPPILITYSFFSSYSTPLYYIHIVLVLVTRIVVRKLAGRTMTINLSHFRSHFQFFPSNNYF